MGKNGREKVVKSKGKKRGYRIDRQFKGWEEDWLRNRQRE